MRRSPSIPSQLGRIALSVLVLIFGIGIALETGRSSAEPKAHVSLGGALTQSNSRNGQAIFSAGNLGPGGSTSGTVTIGNTGTVAGALSLSPVDLVDSQGAHAGVLSTVLQMSVQDITAGSDGQVYTGTLANMPALDLSTLVPGDNRTYRFTATVPDGGIPVSDETGDNALQASSVSVGFDWTLTQTTPTRCQNQMRGAAKGDRLIGTQGGDDITGLGGNDRIKGMLGDDCVNGGTGNDKIKGNGGDDTLIGGPGKDRLRGFGGDDVLRSRDGHKDVVYCGGGNDVANINRGDKTSHCEQVKRRH